MNKIFIVGAFGTGDLENSVGKWYSELKAQIVESIKDCLRGMTITNLEEAFADFNSNLDQFTQSLSKSPREFNPSAFSTVVSLSKNVILPVAMVILAFVFVTELYEFIKDTNSGMGGFNQSKFIELMGMTVIFLFITIHAMDISFTIFKIGAQAAQKAGTSTSVTISDSIWKDIATEEDIGTLISAVVTSFIIKLSMMVINICLLLCMYIRMFEIYIYLCAAPAPFATLQSKDWGETGKNYIRALIALSLQAFFMLAMIAIYGAILNSMGTSGAGNLSKDLCQCVAYCVLVVLMLFKAGNISKSIFNAH